MSGCPAATEHRWPRKRRDDPSERVASDCQDIQLVRIIQLRGEAREHCPEGTWSRRRRRWAWGSCAGVLRAYLLALSGSSMPSSFLVPLERCRAVLESRHHHLREPASWGHSHFARSPNATILLLLVLLWYCHELRHVMRCSPSQALSQATITTHIVLGVLVSFRIIGASPALQKFSG